MMNKTIRIYCDVKDNLKVQKIAGNHISRGGMLVEEKDGTVKLTFDCEFFKVHKLIHDMNILNKIGIRTEMKRA